MRGNKDAPLDTSNSSAKAPSTEFLADVERRFAGRRTYYMPNELDDDFAPDRAAWRWT